MKATYFYTALIVFGLIFTACSSTKPPLTTKEVSVLPEWYLNPPANSEQYLYGIGEGNNMDEARKKALETMVSQLGVSIASTYESTLKVHKKYAEYFTKETSFELTSEVAKIHISNHEVLQGERLNYKQFIVLIRSDRPQFSQALQKEVQHQLNTIGMDHEAIKQSNVLSRHAFYDKSLQSLNALFSTVLVLNALEPTYDDQAYFKTVDQLNTQFQALKERMTFSLQGNADSTAFQDEIAVALGSDNKRITKQRHDKDHIRIMVRSHANYAKAHGFDIARTSLVIEVKDNQDKMIVGNRLNLVGHATQGKKVALDNTVKKLKELIHERGIEKVMGLGVL